MIILQIVPCAGLWMDGAGLWMDDALLSRPHEPLQWSCWAVVCSEHCLEDVWMCEYPGESKAIALDLCEAPWYARPNSLAGVHRSATS
jgi:hypothetical protein